MGLTLLRGMRDLKLGTAGRLVAEPKGKGRPQPGEPKNRRDLPMKRMVLLALIASGLLYLIPASRAGKEDDHDAKAEEEVRALEKQRVDALLRTDWQTLDKIWADDFMQITHLGEYRNKRHRAIAFKSCAVKYDVITNDYDGFRIYGDVALVTGIGTRKGQEGNRKISGQFRFTRVWVKKEGRWQLVHMQSTRYIQ
jgi:ketosteroid isomerase-like protein